MNRNEAVDISPRQRGESAPRTELRGMAAEALEDIDRLLAALPTRPDIAEMRFGDTLNLIAAGT